MIDPDDQRGIRGADRREAVLALCDCPAEVTGQITERLSLVGDWDLFAHGLDGAVQV